MTGRRWWLLAVAVLVTAWTLGGEWVSIHHGVSENHLLDALGGLVFLTGGIVAVDRRPGNIIGPLMIIFAVTIYFGNWANIPAPMLPLFAVVSGEFPPALLAHIALSYPTGRLRTTLDRVVVGILYAIAAGFSLVLVLTFDPRTAGCAGCSWEPAILPDKPVAVAAIAAEQRLAIVLVPLFLVAVWRRWRRASRAERRDLAPLWFGVCLISAVYLMGVFASPFLDDGYSYFVWELQSVVQMGIPVVFVWGLLSTRLARSAVGDLMVELERSLPPGELRSLLARSLGDPSLDLVYALGGRHGWVDADGRPATVPEPGTGPQARATTVVERDGRLLAVLVHDPALDPGLVRAAAVAAGITIENERLHAEVRAQLEEVLASRQRIVEAGDRERRRVERNLHDGAQQRLATLALSLAMLRDRDNADPTTATALAQASTDLRMAIDELRELARGIHPAILTEEGLPAAVESLADRGALPVRVHADLDDRLPEPVEAIAYFVVAESLTNVAKYAHATGADVQISRRDGTLRVQVCDDGVGGADPNRGSGLRGLADRVSAVRGSFRVDTPPGGGTRVLAEIPCEP